MNPNTTKIVRELALKSDLKSAKSSHKLFTAVKIPTRTTRTSTGIVKTLKKAATIKTGIAPTEKFTTGLIIVCLSLKGGIEYMIPAKIPRTTKTVTKGIPVITPRFMDKIKKLKKT
ncbi:unnamed protein product [marine sediment metagenome]|uniref:Uncharacterized protein n=1 Tax=marine sediment metagenome TaxID=412755 RepID=X1B5P8_9ZZZZ